MRRIEAARTGFLSSTYELTDAGGPLGTLHIGRWGRPTTWETAAGTVRFERRSIGSWTLTGDLAGPIDVERRFFSSRSTVRWAGREAVARTRPFRMSMHLMEGEQVIGVAQPRGVRRFEVDVDEDLPDVLAAILVVLADLRRRNAAGGAAGGGG